MPGRVAGRNLLHRLLGTGVRRVEVPEVVRREGHRRVDAPTGRAELLRLERGRLRVLVRRAGHAPRQLGGLGERLLRVAREREARLGELEPGRGIVGVLVGGARHLLGVPGVGLGVRPWGGVRAARERLRPARDVHGGVRRETLVYAREPAGQGRGLAQPLQRPDQGVALPGVHGDLEALRDQRRRLGRPRLGEGLARELALVHVETEHGQAQQVEGVGLGVLQRGLEELLPRLRVARPRTRPRRLAGRRASRLATRSTIGRSPRTIGGFGGGSPFRFRPGSPARSTPCRWRSRRRRPRSSRRSTAM